MMRKIYWCRLTQSRIINRTITEKRFGEQALILTHVTFRIAWSRHAMRSSIADRFTVFTRFWRDARINWISFTVVFKRTGILEYSKQHDKKGISYICCSTSIIEHAKIKRLWQSCNKMATSVAISSYEL